MKLDVKCEAVGRCLGWSFDRCGVVDLFGHAVLAFARDPTRTPRPAEGWLPASQVELVGVAIDRDGDVRNRLQVASEFAGYCARALLIGDGERIEADARAWAAMLDVGLVVGAGELSLLSPAGPRVPGSMWSVAESELLERVAVGLGIRGAVSSAAAG